MAVRKTVLLVDDDSDSADLVEQILADVGFHVVVARDGVDAIELLEQLHVDLVVSDLSMPEMDGFELCRRIRSSRRLPNVPVLFISASAGHQRRLKGIDAGANAYLPKPIDDVLLIEKVHRLLDGPRADAEPVR